MSRALCAEQAACEHKKVKRQPRGGRRRDRSAVFISAEELAGRLSIHPSSVSRGLCGTGALPRFRFGRTVRFRLTDLLTLEAHIQQSFGEPRRPAGRRR